MKIIILTLGFFASFHIFASYQLQKISFHLHQICLAMAPSSQWNFAYKAIVCGAPLINSSLKRNLVVAGLLHLIVVSGSHLIFLQALLEKLFYPWPWGRKLIPIILILFALVTNLQPPTVRSLIAFFVSHISTVQHLFWSPPQKVLVSGFLTLLLFPNWVHSLSFLMSWTAGFALASNPFSVKKILYHIWVFLILFPIFLPISPLNPISILMNFFFASFIGMILFPFSLLGFMHPIFVPLVDSIWALIDWILSGLAFIIPPPLPPIIFPTFWLWCYIFCLQLISHVYKIIVCRQQP